MEVSALYITKPSTLSHLKDCHNDTVCGGVGSDDCGGGGAYIQLGGEQTVLWEGH